MLNYKLRTCCEGRRQIWKLKSLAACFCEDPGHFGQLLRLLAIAATTSHLLLFFSNMHANGKKTQSMPFPSSLNPLCFMVHDLSQASCKSWLSGVFCLVYYFSLDCGIEFPCAAAAAAESQGRAWLAFEMKQTEQGRLFIRSKHIIVEKVWAATTCRSAREDVKAVWWWCRQVRTVSKRWGYYSGVKSIPKQNQHFNILAKTQTVKAIATPIIFRRAANTQTQHRTHNNNNNNNSRVYHAEDKQYSNIL